MTFKLSSPKTDSKSSITVADMDNVVTTLAHCCSPVKGDEIIGYISHRRGITIHRQDCENIRHLTAEQTSQLVKAEWSGSHKAQHSVPIVIEALHAQNLLIEVSQLLHYAKVQITDAALKTHADQSATLTMQIQIENTAQLSQVLGRISQLGNVVDVKRKA
jgi:GTP pyrophosphokinase